MDYYVHIIYDYRCYPLVIELMMDRVIQNIEISQINDRYVDYCLWDYEPLTDPANKWRSINILNKSFENQHAEQELLDVCRILRNGLGEFQTVWGVKNVNNQLSWEWYFYDYKRTQRSVSIPRVIQLLQPYMVCNLVDIEIKPYFMFSIEMDEKILLSNKQIDEISVYIGNVGSTVSSGICYALVPDGMYMENIYFFFDRDSEIELIRGKAASSAYLDPSMDWDQLFIPELMDCKTIVISNKTYNDGIYFSRINVNQLLFFLMKMGYAENLVQFVQEHESKFTHLLFDVGFDYTIRNGEFKILKSSFYGVF